MVTNVLIDGKWYLLLFRKMAQFLVEESSYNVLFVSYGSPPEKVTKENYEELDKKVKHFEDIHTSGDCFLLELELPSVEINVNTYNSKVSINSTYIKNNYLYHKITTHKAEHE